MTADTITTEIRHTIGPDGLLALNVRNGDVRVRGTDGDDVVVRSRRGAALDGLKVDRGDRSLSIGTGTIPFIGQRRGGSLDLDVEVPAAATVVIEAASSDIVADGLTGDQRLRTASGDVVVRGGTGTIAVDAMSGDVRIEAVGSVGLDLRTVSGDLGVRAGSIRGLRAVTTSGDLSIVGRLDGDGPFAIVTVSGDVQLAPEGGLRVDVRTITGDVRTSLPHRIDQAAGRRSIVIGDGGPTVDVRSTSGDIAILAAPGMPAASELAPGPIDPGAPEPAVAGSLAPDVPGPAPATAPDPATAADPAVPPPTEGDARLEVLRALERGEIDLDLARARLEAIDHAEEVDHVG